MKRITSILPKWVLLFGILGYFAAEIVTASTPINKYNIGTPIFSFSYYIIQLAVVADLILRKKLSFLGIFILGLIFGLLEEAFYIKNPLILTILLPIGHAAVTVLFPYLIVNLLSKQEKKPFLSRNHYAFFGIYLAFLYVYLGFSLPFPYIDSLIFSLITLPVLIFLLYKTGTKNPTISNSKINKKEWGALIAISVFFMALMQQNFSAVFVLLVWFILRGKQLSKHQLLFAGSLYIIFHYLFTVFNKTGVRANLFINYPLAFIMGALIIFLLFKKTKDKSFIAN
ncbi:MAG: hypothetical protein M1326_04705 [Cyanobacteria bacterium]|nr:hypothetical protein [Cyanobacteriota bacterium]MCL5020035.1 hypothetical protein [Patescibacteria group bacterium]